MLMEFEAAFGLLLSLPSSSSHGKMEGVPLPLICFFCTCSVRSLAPQRSLLARIHGNLLSSRKSVGLKPWAPTVRRGPEAEVVVRSVRLWVSPLGVRL